MSKRPTEDLIRQQAQRLLAMANAPVDVHEVSVALKRWSETEYHVKAIVQFLLDNQHFFPTPAAIRDEAQACLKEPPPKYRPVNPDCADCNGGGWAPLEKDGKRYVTICLCRVIGAPMPPSLERTKEPVEL